MSLIWEREEQRPEKKFPESKSLMIGLMIEAGAASLRTTTETAEMTGTKAMGRTTITTTRATIIISPSKTTD